MVIDPTFPWSPRVHSLLLDLYALLAAELWEHVGIVKTSGDIVQHMRWARLTWQIQIHLEDLIRDQEKRFSLSGNPSMN